MTEFKQWRRGIELIVGITPAESEVARLAWNAAIEAVEKKVLNGSGRQRVLEELRMLRQEKSSESEKYAEENL